MVEKSETAVRKLIEEPPFYLDWSHYLILMRVENKDERSFYEIEAKNENWSKRDLQKQYNSSLYERLALSKDKNGLMKLANEENVVENPILVIVAYACARGYDGYYVSDDATCDGTYLVIHNRTKMIIKDNRIKKGDK